MNSGLVRVAVYCCLIINLPLFAAGERSGNPLKLTETRVCLENQFSSFGYYNSCPESPDGSRITYVVYDQAPIGPDTKVDGSLWVCNRDLTNHRMVKKLGVKCTNHNGALQQWVDNDTIAYSSPGPVNGAIYLVNADNGEIEFGPYTGGYIGDNNIRGKVLICIRYKSNVGEAGLYELDTKTGKVRCIFKVNDYVKYYDTYKWGGNKDVRTWKIAHAMYSADGSYIAFEIVPALPGRKFYLFTSKPDGNDLRYWGGDQPMHYQWYDSNTLWGSDEEVDDGQENNKFFKRWDRNKKFIETLGGPGCHTGASADGQWVAGESWYKSNPVKLQLYKRGKTQPVATIFETINTDMIWAHNGHVSPSFSRDGKRLYYNRAVSNQLKQAYCCDLSELMRK
jgi:hypothetical protein